MLLEFVKGEVVKRLIESTDGAAGVRRASSNSNCGTIDCLRAKSLLFLKGARQFNRIARDDLPNGTLNTRKLRVKGNTLTALQRIARKNGALHQHRLPIATIVSQETSEDSRNRLPSPTARRSASPLFEFAS